ncbi:Aldo/keto reductase [Fomitiporia mediterranea MF3/22]|uniref:Aldo/keto reductase n=1 Tax=Fomitiporia mediterranea (strain MF3/22) TaxID=694068 RepID=UPI000440756A|nr:Aldo/keto reductase [Fomitiporia mediterranea MF3/22]EJC99035.1 Aldo/keto reductase [Fomitiporia mediterranea MF3/22]
MPVKSFKLSDGRKIPWIAFGTGTALYKKDCANACKLALSVGFTHLDAAQMYENEEGVGAAIASNIVSRDSLYITTKLQAIPAGQTVEQTLNESLKKLQTSYVDLFLVHVPTQHTSREGGLQQVWREMVDVKDKGLTRSIGVSNFNKAYLKEVIDVGLDKPAVNQIEYHPLVANRLAPLLEYSKEQGIITASYGSLSPILPSRTTNESLKPVLSKFTSALDKIAQSRGPTVTQSQILFKWLEAQQVVAVTTSSKESRLKEYLQADELADLSEEDKKVISDAVGDAHFRAFSAFSHMDDN